MGVGERMVGRREGVTANGLGAAVTGSIFQQAVRVNVRIARVAGNHFIFTPRTSSIIRFSWNRRG